jgi:N-methylhydantoinase A
VLGYLQNLTGGSFKLDVDAAKHALDVHVGRPLGLTTIEAAHAVHRLVNAHMADAMRVMSSEAALSPAELTLMVYGGAGPVHGAALASEMEIKRTIIPAHPGALSALGAATGDLVHDLVQPIMKPLSVLDAPELARHFEHMREQGREILAGEACLPEDMEFQPYFVARYIGQMHDLQVELQEHELMQLDLDKLSARFHENHRKAYGIQVETEPILLVSARMRAIARVEKPSFAKYSGHEVPSPERHAEAWFEETGFMQVPVYQRQPWKPFAAQDGPAIISEYDSTTVVLPGQQWHMDEFGSIVIEEK